MRKAMIGDIAVMPGDELVRRFGPEVGQQLASLAVKALQIGDEGAARAIGLRLAEVHVALEGSTSHGAQWSG